MGAGVAQGGGGRGASAMTAGGTTMFAGGIARFASGIAMSGGALVIAGAITPIGRASGKGAIGGILMRCRPEGPGSGRSGPKTRPRWE